MGWLSSAWNTTKSYGKKAVDVAQKAGQMYDKAKETYQKGKEMFSSLPVVGNVAAELFGKGEAFLKNKLKEKTGLSAEDIDAKINEARGAIGEISSALN